MIDVKLVDVVVQFGVCMCEMESESPACQHNLLLLHKYITKNAQGISRYNDTVNPPPHHT